jgi:hypothetical protein
LTHTPDVRQDDTGKSREQTLQSAQNVLHQIKPQQKTRATFSPCPAEHGSLLDCNQTGHSGALMQHPAQQKGSNWPGTFMSQ